MSAPMLEVQVTVLSLYGAYIPLHCAQTAEDFDSFAEWLSGVSEGWTTRLRTEHIVPAPGLVTA